MPLYALAAHLAGLPGWTMRTRIAGLGVHLLRAGRQRVGTTALYNLFCFPMDSTRYFEFDFVWRRLAGVEVREYLDVSSPRLLPVLVLRAHPAATARLLNPDEDDLAQTRAMVEACGLLDRCGLEARTLDQADLAEGRFDLVTSISVVEHIRDDLAAIERMWRAVRPGGRMLLTLPAAARAESQFLNVPTYAFAAREPDGSAFHQYLYDEQRLEQVYRVTGRPAHLEVWGERVQGAHLALWQRKWQDEGYPFWREPWTIRRMFRPFRTVSELPGEGVVMLEFVK